MFGAIPIAPLVYTRCVFGAVMVWEIGRYIGYGWVPDTFNQNRQFKYYGFEWVRAWPEPWSYVHVLVVGAAAAMMAVGAWYRLAGALFFVGFTYIFLLEQADYLNHLYLVCLLGFLMMLMPAHRAASFDVWLRPQLLTADVPAWTLWLLRFQVGIVYFFGGLAKLDPDWLRGEPIRMWMDGSHYPIVGTLLATEPAVWVITYGGLLFDLLIVPTLLWRRTRALAWVAAILFNLLNAFMFDIGIFPWLMLGLLPLFLPITWWRRANAALFVLFGYEDASSTPAARPRGALGATVVTLVAAWVLVQILVPLRHHLYPGWVSWTEEGHRFAWRMKLRSKRGLATFVVTHPQLPRQIEIDPAEYLTADQLRKMAAQPDMVLQYSHWLVADYREMGYDGVEVYARVEARLNGRRPQPLIDPGANLAAHERSLRHSKWILPLREPLPRNRLPWWHHHERHHATEPEL